MVRGSHVVLEVCPGGPSKNTEEKIKFKLIAYHTIAENLGDWLSPFIFPSSDIL